MQPHPERITELNNLEQRLAALPERAQRDVAGLIAALEAHHRPSYRKCLFASE